MSGNEKVIVQPTRSKKYEDLEYSAHYLPKSMLREVRHVFAGVDLPDEVTIALPIVQKASLALTNWGNKEAVEKDRLLERFLAWGNSLRSLLTAAGQWSDFTDPCTGLPYHGASAGSIYPDVDGFERLLHYPIDGSMGCRIMSHPEWRFACYPTTFFTTADADTLMAALRKHDGE